MEANYLLLQCRLDPVSLVFKGLFIYLAAWGPSLWCVGSNSLTRDHTPGPQRWEYGWILFPTRRIKQKRHVQPGRPGHQKAVLLSAWILSVGQFPLEETSSHLLGSFLEAHVVKISQQGTEASVQASLWMTVALAIISTTTSWEVLNQNHPEKPWFPDPQKQCKMINIFVIIFMQL